jgi:hypothetical protein
MALITLFHYLLAFELEAEGDEEKAEGQEERAEAPLTTSHLLELLSRTQGLS